MHPVCSPPFYTSKYIPRFTLGDWDNYSHPHFTNEEQRLGEVILFIQGHRRQSLRKWV